jgi:hypothetical protein
MTVHHKGTLQQVSDTLSTTNVLEASTFSENVLDFENTSNE